MYFCDRLYSEDDLPPEFKLYLPVVAKKDGAAPEATAAGEDL